MNASSSLCSCTSLSGDDQSRSVTGRVAIRPLKHDDRPREEMSTTSGRTTQNSLRSWTTTTSGRIEPVSLRDDDYTRGDAP